MIDDGGGFMPLPFFKKIMAIELHKKVTAQQITLSIGNGATPLKVNDRDVEVVIYGMANTIAQRRQKYNTIEEQIAALSIWLQGVIKSYFGDCGGTINPVFTACAKYTIEKYSFLGVEEIEKAFMMAAENKPEDMKAYYGSFTIVQYISIIKEYAAWRGRVKSAIQSLAEKTELTVEEIEAKNAEAQKYFEMEFEKAEKTPPQHWRELNIFLCKRWIEMGFCGLSTDKTAIEIYQNVYEASEIETKKELDRLRLSINGTGDMYSHRELMGNQEKQNAFRNDVFAKMLVYHYLTNNNS